MKSKGPQPGPGPARAEPEPEGSGKEFPLAACRTSSSTSATVRLYAHATSCTGTEARQRDDRRLRRGLRHGLGPGQGPERQAGGRAGRLWPPSRVFRRRPWPPWSRVQPPPMATLVSDPPTAAAGYSRHRECHHHHRRSSKVVRNRDRGRPDPEGTVMGRLCMPPEQASGKLHAVDAAMLLAGAILYEMITSTRRWTGGLHGGADASHGRADFRPSDATRSARRQDPRELSAIVLGAGGRPKSLPERRGVRRDIEAATRRPIGRRQARYHASRPGRW